MKPLVIHLLVFLLLVGTGGFAEALEPVKPYDNFEQCTGKRWKGEEGAARDVPLHLPRFRHSHGGTGCGSAHNPFFASRASFSNPSRTVSPGAYFRYH